MNTNTNSYTSEGTLRVAVTTTGSTVPVENAVVLIFPYSADGASAGDDVLYSLRTDRNGLTAAVALPAPPASASMSPGSELPYALYNISVTYDGYYPVENIGVPIFAGVGALQSVNLLPLTEAESIAGAWGERIMIYETPLQQNLTPGGIGEDGESTVGNSNGAVSGGAVSETAEREE